MAELRIGQGFDLHRWSSDRPLLLAGVLFEGEPGLEGHSDGDAVCHAAADALLGAAALGDVGMLFPDTDPTNAGMAGTDLLRRTVSALHSAALIAVSIDLTVICERPAIAPRREEMRAALAAALALDLGRVSVKATRPEGLGFSGDGVGCLALATIAERA